MADKEKKERFVFIDEDEESGNKIEDFQILLFQTNPTKRSIKVWFPLEDFSTYMKSTRFVDEVCKIMGEDYRHRLEYCLREYGGMYVVNRHTGEIKSASAGRESIDRSPKQILDSYIEENPSLINSSFHEVHLNNVSDIFSKINPFQ